MTLGGEEPHTELKKGIGIMNKMIKNVMIIAVIHLLFFSSGYGQENEGIQKNKFGVGVMIERGSKIYFPILIKPRIRLEPEISFNQNEYKKNDFESEYTALSVGMGVLSLTQYENITTYYGVRFGYINTLNKNEYNFLTREGISKNTQNGYYIAPVGGAEYSFAKRFSIGPEISIDYSNSNGNENTDDSNNNSSSKSLMVNGGVVLRFYLK